MTTKPESTYNLVERLIAAYLEKFTNHRNRMVEIVEADRLAVTRVAEEAMREKADSSK